ncbi:MAG: class I SAM-dependent methyltransferase [Candidatus Bathyarchaeia archaeon]
MAQEEHFSASATLSILRDNPKLAAQILLFLDKNLKEKNFILDLGCGYGYLTAMFRDILKFKKAYGVDIDKDRLETAERVGIEIYNIDLETSTLPFHNNYFDLILATGILNHLKFWDNIFSEINRVLKKGGLLFISDPNMGWWINRLSLFLGYQPPNVEVSKFYTVGLPPFYPRLKSIEYVHSLTLRGMLEFLNLYGFKNLYVFRNKIPRIDLKLKKPQIPYLLQVIIRIIDNVFYIFPSLSARILVVSEKVSDYKKSIDIENRLFLC